MIINSLGTLHNFEIGAKFRLDKKNKGRIKSKRELIRKMRNQQIITL